MPVIAIARFLVWFNANMTWFCEVVLRLCAWSNSIIMMKESKAAHFIKEIFSFLNFNT